VESPASNPRTTPRSPRKAQKISASKKNTAQTSIPRTDLIKLENLVLGTQLGQQILAGLAVRAVRLGEDDDAVVVNELLSLGLGGGHGGGRGAGEGAEEALENERNGGRVMRGKETGGVGFFLFVFSGDIARKRGLGKRGGDCGIRSLYPRMMSGDIR
jgi:hypothetical protein